LAVGLLSCCLRRTVEAKASALRTDPRAFFAGGGLFDAPSRFFNGESCGSAIGSFPSLTHRQSKPAIRWCPGGWMSGLN